MSREIYKDRDRLRDILVWRDRCRYRDKKRDSDR